MKRLNLYFALVLAFVLAVHRPGRSVAGHLQPEGAGAHATVTAIANSAGTLRAAGKLSDADRDNVVSTLAQRRGGHRLGGDDVQGQPAGRR